MLPRASKYLGKINFIWDHRRASVTGGFDLKIILHNYLTFSIQDEGIGMPAEYQAKLFQRFERAGNVGSIKGTGLGLSIVKQAVELHRGEITVISEEGRGTKFTVTLPSTK